MRIKKYLRYLFGIAFVVFVLNKFFIRPWVIENELPEIFKIIVFSIPNLSEAIMGTICVTMIAFRLRRYFKKDIKDTIIYLISVSISSIYVISQELKFHNLGGNNIYDPYDIIASLIGLVMTFGMIQSYGFADEVELDRKNRNE